MKFCTTSTSMKIREYEIIYIPCSVPSFADAQYEHPKEQQNFPNLLYLVHKYYTLPPKMHANECIAYMGYSRESSRRQVSNKMASRCTAVTNRPVAI